MSKTLSVKQKRQKGFTILELLIATVIFSLVLVLCATAIIQVGRIFYKGVTVNKVQDIARVVADDVAQAIQFGGSADAANFYQEGSSGNLKWRCIGAVRYIFNSNQIIGENGVKHGLWKDRPANCSDSISSGMLNQDVPTAGGKELLGKNMRISELEISEGSVWRINLTVAYGPSDLFVDQGTFKQCLNRDRGGQFCAVSTITTNAIKRL